MKKIFMSILMGLFAVVIFTGCTSQAEDSDSISYRQKFTDSEMEEGHAEFDIVEHLLIDADITPLEKYEDGLNSYYQTHYSDEGDISDEDFSDEATIFGYSQADFFSWLKKVTGGSCNMDSQNWSTGGKAALLQIELQTERECFDVTIEWDSAGGVFENCAYYPCLYLTGKEENSANAYYYGLSMMTYLRDYEGELSFADRTETAEKWICWLEELSGREISDIWDCIAVSEDTVAELEQSGYGEIDSEVEESYFYKFYYEIDGLPTEYIQISYEMEENESCTDIAASSQPDGSNLLINLPEWPQVVVVGESGISYMELDNFRDKGEIYKEALDIRTPTEILEKIVSYYDTKLLLDDMIITDMHLIYNSGFTDGEDGPIDNVFCPMWKVTVYDCEAEQNKVFLYDAETAEAYYEAYELSN